MVENKIHLYSQNENYKLYNGSMLDMLEVIEPNSIDSIVTDPPYELNFMRKGWDNSGIAFQKDAWEKCYQALKPGGYLLAFGGSRTFHRIACAIEDAGFEIRDTIMWLYGSGFPKSMNIGLALDKKNGVESKIVDEAQNEWNGWGTCLKPAYEPIIVARKPVENSTIDNVMKYGVGGINIDECRVPTTDYLYNHGNSKGTIDSVSVGNFGKAIKGENKSTQLGRFPANVILTYDEIDEQEVCGNMPTSDRPNGSITETNYNNSTGDNGIYGHYSKNVPLWESYNDSGSVSRYFYCAKASKFDRDEGLDEFEEKKCSMLASNDNIDEDGNFTGMLAGRNTVKRNVHPTVKPTELMRYLVRLVSPKGATILDCFNGSGSTGKAVMLENKEFNKDYKYIGVELTEEYLPIAKARIEYICNNEFDFTKEKREVIKEKVEKNTTNKDSVNMVDLW